MNNFFYKLQKMSQNSDSGVEVFIDEDGEVEFETDLDIFLAALQEWRDQAE